jgi:hypothetical protein
VLSRFLPRSTSLSSMVKFNYYALFQTEVTLHMSISNLVHRHHKQSDRNTFLKDVTDLMVPLLCHFSIICCVDDIIVLLL